MENGTVSPFASVPTWLRAVHGTVLSALLLTSVLGNGTVLFLVFNNKTLRYRSIIVSLGLVVADLLMAIVWNFQAISTAIAGEWPFTDLGCDILGFLLQTLLYVRWFEVAVIVLDRFFLIVFPMSYQTWNKALMIVLTILAWLVPVIISLPTPITGYGYELWISLSACSLSNTDSNTDKGYSYFYISLFGIFLIIGGVMPTVLYLILYCIGRHKRLRMRQELQLGEQQESADSGKSRRLVRRRSIVFIQERDRRALLTFFIVFLCIFTTQLPVYVTSALHHRNDIFPKIPTAVHFVFLYIYMLSTVLDPIVIMRNKDFKEAFLHYFRRRLSSGPAVQALSLRRQSLASNNTTSSEGNTA